jgi:hypothetical protein
MKSVSQIKWSAFVALAAIGAMGAVGACSKDGGPGPDPVEIAAPTVLAATVVSETQIDLAWTDNATNEDGYRIESCSGAACANFAQVGTVAANVNTFSNTGLTAATSYSFRVRAHNAEGASDFSNTVSASTEIIPPPPPPPTALPVLIGAGEITNCSSVGAVNTARIVDSVLTADTNATAFTLGNNLSGAVGTPTMETCFGPTWGQFKDRTFFALGQGDYESVGTSELYGYFGARVGPPNGWYSFDKGNWHIIVLNTATWQHGVNNLTGETGPSEMLTWLAGDLAAAQSKRCIMAISWQRRFYSGTTETFENQNMRTITRMLNEAGADVLVSGNDRVYSRFAKQTFDGEASPTGIRQFIVGTGGRSLANTAGLVNPPTLEVRDASVHGVIKFTLDTASYNWEFIPTVAGGFTDSGTTGCN